MKCPKCSKELTPALGPTKARYAAIVYEPFGNSLLEQEADHLLANELYRLGINSLEVRLVSLWGHAEGDKKEVSWHINRAVRSVKGCSKVMLFGTDVTTVLLGEGISKIVGLVRPCAYLPDAICMPLPHPGHAITKPLGEFRLCLEKLVRN